MDCKTVSFDDGYQRLLNIAEEKFEKGDLEGTLSFFFRAFDKKPTLSAVEGIADMQWLELPSYRPRCEDGKGYIPRF